MSSLTIATPPAAAPLSLALVKSHLRVSIKDDDELIKVYSAAACELAESETGRSFVNKGYCQMHDRFPSLRDWGDFGTGYFYQTRKYSRHHDHDHRQEIRLLRCPLLDVEQIVYIDQNGDEQTLLPAPELWQASTEYSLGDQVQDSNGNLQQITAVADSGANKDGSFSSGASAPTWSASLNGTCTDGPFTWTCVKVPAPAGDFIVDRESEPPRIMPNYAQFWPLTLRVPNAVKVFFNAGYGSSGISVPAVAKVLQLQLIASWYENREAVTPETLKTIPVHLENLVWSIRVTDFAPTH